MILLWRKIEGHFDITTLVVGVRSGADRLESKFFIETDSWSQRSVREEKNSLRAELSGAVKGSFDQYVPQSATAFTTPDCHLRQFEEAFSVGNQSARSHATPALEEKYDVTPGI